MQCLMSVSESRMLFSGVKLSSSLVLRCSKRQKIMGFYVGYTRQNIIANKLGSRVQYLQIYDSEDKKIEIIIFHMYLHGQQLVYYNHCIMRHFSVLFLVIKMIVWQEMEDRRDLPEKLACYEGVFYNYFSIGWPSGLLELV